MKPMLPSLGDITKLSADDYAWEGKYDGFRLLLRSTDGRLHLQSRSGRDVTHEFPSISPLRHNVLLDGEVVGLDENGVPSFNRIQNRLTTPRVEFWAFDVLELRGRDLTRNPYRDRRRVLEALGVESGIVVPELLTGTAQEALDRSQQMLLEGVVAKRWDSTYLQGRAKTWLKHKHWHSIDAVIGGWKVGNGRRDGGIGALLMGMPENGKLRYIGKVGTGFTEAELERLKVILEPLHTAQSPFHDLSRHETVGVTYVKPLLVGEVQYQELSADGKARHPSWRGIRTDKTPSDLG